MRCRIDFLGIMMLLLLILTSSCHGLNIQVRTVQSASDITALATLRYNEWMMDEEVRRDAFTAATYELFQERAAQRAVVFLATMGSKREEPAGAVELSPIELDRVLLPASNQGNNNNPHQFLYATDLVTAIQFRRQGVAAALMKAVEQHCFPGHLLLHVEPDNGAALAFYEKLGYRKIENAHDIVGSVLDLERLTDNAGTKGQLLLAKSSLEVDSNDENPKIRGMGFGSKSASASKSIKPKSKRSR